MVQGTAHGIRKQRHAARENQTRQARHEKGRAPSVMLGHEAPEAKAQGRPDRDGEIEPRELGGPLVFGNHIAEDGGAQSGVSRLPHAHQRAREQQHRITVDEGRQNCRNAPQRHPRRYETRPMVAIRGPAENRRRAHVNDDEDQGQPPELGIRQVQILAQRFQDRSHHVAVEVVHQVDRGQQGQELLGGLQQGGPGSEGRLWAMGYRLIAHGSLLCALILLMNALSARQSLLACCSASSSGRNPNRNASELWYSSSLADPKAI